MTPGTRLKPCVRSELCIRSGDSATGVRLLSPPVAPLDTSEPILRGACIVSLILLHTIHFHIVGINKGSSLSPPFPHYGKRSSVWPGAPQGPVPRHTSP